MAASFSIGERVAQEEGHQRQRAVEASVEPVFGPVGDQPEPDRPGRDTDEQEKRDPRQPCAPPEQVGHEPRENSPPRVRKRSAVFSIPASVRCTCRAP
jgi:hypothetical protein